MCSRCAVRVTGEPAMSQPNLSPDSVNSKPLSSAQTNCRCSVYPGHVMKVSTSDEDISTDTASRWQKTVMPQSLLNSSSEIRSRKRSVPLRRGSADARVNEQLELIDLDCSPRVSHGHRFISASLSQPTWCDKCGDFIWGVYKQCLICTSMSNTFSFF